MNGLRVDPQGRYSPYILWDLSEVTGPVTITAPSGGTTRLDGSIYAPNADLTVTAAPLDGQVLGQNVTIGGGGEVHSFMFAGTIACDDSTVPGTFELQKALSGISADDLPAGTVFTVDYEAVLPDGRTEIGSIDLPADGSAVAAGVDFPPGTVVTFDELAPQSVPGWTWGTPTIEPNPITIEADTTTSVTLTNTATPTPVGTITLQKTIVDQNGDPLPFVPAGDVAVHWVSSDGREGTTQVPMDGTIATVDATFPLGTTVSFTEDFIPPPGYDWTDATWTPGQTVTVSGSTTPTAVVVTNVLTPVEGRVIRVVKNVDGAAAAAYDFTIEYNTTAPNGDRVTRPLEVGEPQTLTDVADDVETLYLVENVPYLNGVSDASLWETPLVRVTSNAGIQDFTAPYGTEIPIDISDGGDIAISITNAHVPVPEATFALQKAFVLSDTLGAHDLRATFGFAVEWTATTPDGAISTGTLRLPADGTEISPLDADGDPLQFPYGTQITYTEIDLPNEPGIDWNAPTYSPATLTIGADDQAVVTGTVVNSGTYLRGTFQVRKELAGIDAALLGDGTFTIDYVGETPLGAVITGAFELPVDGTPAGPSATFPVGSTLWLTERAPDASLLPAGYEWQTTSWSPQSFIEIGAGVTPELTVTNTVKQFTQYSLTKTVAGGGASALPPGAAFSGHAWLNNVQQPDISLQEGQTYVSRWVPVGTVVEAQETGFPDVPGITWGEPVWMLADGTVLEPEQDGRVVLPAADMGTVDAVALVLENQAASTPTPTPSPTRAPLPATGGTVSSVGGLLGFAALLLGIALVARHRARSRV